jgi:amino acid adenylation domain-containing protein
LHYQRKEVSEDPATLEWNARTMLSDRVTLAIRNLETPPEGFFLAGVGGFMARLRNQPSILLAYDDQIIRLSVDGSLPFHDLLSQVDAQRKGNSASKVSAHDTRPDAFLRLSRTPVSDHGAAPGGEGGVSDRALHFAACMTDEGWEISADGWQGAQAERNLKYLSRMLESAAQNPEQPTGTLLLASEETAIELYQQLNETAQKLPHATVLDLFTEKVAVYGEEDSVRFGDASLSYSRLDAESTVLAGTLKARGADQEHPVAVCMQRSEKIPVVLLAALKAGSYFVPLDPSHPKQRLIDMLAECKPAVVIVSVETQALFPETGLPLLLPDFGAAPDQTTPARKAVGSDRAYMIYTSGTTGRPKGVIIQHGALENFLLAMRKRPGLTHEDRLLAVATLSFDMSILDMFLPLVSGATIVIASERAARDPWELSGIFATQGITCMQATPVTWRMLLSSGYKGHPKLKILVGGEALSRDLANDLRPIGREIWNCYGPTETTVYSSVLLIEPGGGPITVGGPMANTVFYVADPDGNLLPPEIAGELYIGGAGVAAGYFERPELNRERFIADPWSGSKLPGGGQPMLFRTGDQVRLAANGRKEFEFYGRLDHQVKLRGYRIELGEIEVVLRSHPSVSDGAVLLREDEPGEPWLVAYVTPRHAETVAAPSELLEFASNRLPAYMLPSRIVTLPALPLTGSGKVDKRALGALPAPDDSHLSAARMDARHKEAQQPLDALETSLLRIFRDTLRQKSFGADDNFFEHGGYSMLAIRLFAKIGTALHKQLPITALFDAPTVRKLADLIRNGNPLQALVPIRENGTEAPFFLVHSYLLYGAAGTIVDQGRPVYGLRERSTTTAPLELQRCVADYTAAINRIWPSGTVHLGGWCAAATLTVELARSMLAQGRQVGMVALFDADALGFVARPENGNAVLARLSAMRRFHLGRMRGLSWSQRLGYINERLTQAPLSLVERIYSRYHARIERWQHSLRWLPSVLFYNRFTQIGKLQTDRIDPLETRIQLFRAKDVTVIDGSDPELGWGSVGHRGVDVFFIPGHHESMFLEPNVDVLREAFQASMRTVEDEIASRRQLRRV